VERRRADRLAQQLQMAQVHERENRRLGRGLLPTPLLRDRSLAVTSRYEPGNAQLLLGGDFYDTVEIADGSVHAIVGDVSGHGPDEAAIGVSLRIAWRTLVLAGMPAEYVLPVLDQLLVTERHDAILFTTVAMISLPADRSHLDLYLAGHPAPVLIAGTTPRLLPDRGLGVPLGVRLGTTWPAVRVPLPREWALMLYTDGLIEARDARGDVLWTDGLVDLLGGLLASTLEEPGEILDAMLAAVDDRMRTDDLAVALLTHTPAVEQRRVWEHEPTAESCAAVRAEIGGFLRAHEVAPDHVDDAVLVAYELAMNAVDHARTPFRLTAILSEAALRIEVTDGSAVPPRVQPRDAHALRGRGLQMVDSIVTSWAVHPEDGGKTVVADLDLT
jgi:anti-sigma regulatory factor (Ser/Thr protein kinase)